MGQSKSKETSYSLVNDSDHNFMRMNNIGDSDDDSSEDEIFNVGNGDKIMLTDID